MSARIEDSRLHQWPRVIRQGKDLRLTCKVMSPVRLRVIDYCVISPLAFLWKVMVFVMVVDGLVFHLKGRPFLGSYDYDRTTIYGVLALFLILWHFEIFSKRRLSRICLGQRLRIRISENWIEIGGLWRQYIFERDKPLMFGLHDYGKSEDSVYSHSKVLCMIVADSSRVRLRGIYGLDLSEYLVENANMMLGLHGEASDGDLDVDPSRVGGRQH